MPEKSGCPSDVRGDLNAAFEEEGAFAGVCCCAPSVEPATSTSAAATIAWWIALGTFFRIETLLILVRLIQVSA
jgi:hypothetical protein